MGNYQQTIYIGVTSNLIGRVWEHKQLKCPGFTFTYKLTKLLYYEVYENISDAINREKQLKNWHRQWKLDLILQFNPSFQDLYNDLLD